MKPPVMPHIAVDEETLRGSEADEEVRVSRDLQANSAAQKDPFADFQAVSKPEAPSEVQLQAEEEKNIDNDVASSSVPGPSMREDTKQRVAGSPRASGSPRSSRRDLLDSSK